MKERQERGGVGSQDQRIVRTWGAGVLRPYLDKKRRPSGRNDSFWALQDVEACNFGEVGPSRDNHLKQNEMRSPAMGQPRVSGLEISGAIGHEETLPRISSPKPQWPVKAADRTPRSAGRCAAPRLPRWRSTCSPGSAPGASAHSAHRHRVPPWLRAEARYAPAEDVTATR